MLRQEKLEIDQQLRAIQGNTSMSSMPNFTVQRRSDRGYSSDVDTMRSNRGSVACTSHQGNSSNTSGSGMRGRGTRGRPNNPRFHPGKNLHKSNDPSDFNNTCDQSISRPKTNNNNNRSENRDRRSTTFHYAKTNPNST